MKQTLKIGELAAAPGTKTQGLYQVAGTDLKMPVSIINGVDDGEVMLITAGVHGGEFPGIVAAIELAKELDPQKIHGAVVIISVVTLSGFEAKDSSHLPEDGKNLNRLFPGDPNGTAGDKLAYAITEDFHAVCDYNIDLHAGNADEDMLPFIFYPAMGGEETEKRSLAMAKVCQVKYLARSLATTGLYNSAAIKGLPSILIERGGTGQWSRQEVDEDKMDCLAVLRLLGFLDQTVPEQVSGPILDEVKYFGSDVTGCWHPQFKPGQMAKEGELLGEIRDYFDNVLTRYVAPYDGVVLYQISTLSVMGGHSLLAFGKVS